LRRVHQALQRQLTLKDQGLERLRQKVQERALMISHEKAADVQQIKRETTHVIEDLEAENVKLRADLAHRTSQLHSAVTRIAALKSRMDDLILKNDELAAAKERAQRKIVSARKRKQTLAQKHGGAGAQTEALATLLGTQDSVLNLIENLSFLPPRDTIGIQPGSNLRAKAVLRESASAPRLRDGAEPTAAAETPLMATPRTTPSTHATHVAAHAATPGSDALPPPTHASSTSPAQAPSPETPAVSFGAVVTSVGSARIARTKDVPPPKLPPPESQSPRFQYAHKRLAAFEAKFGQTAKPGAW
jgi:FtsZ-binding cell division protein ZapB